jgi:UDP:flavonoid glycosyltransferase YjiC (YdhE family)
LKRALIAWELGANWGHMARDLPVALALRQRGYEVLFAVRDVQIAERILGPHDLAYVQSPLPPTKLIRAPPPANYAEILATQGYADAPALRALVRGWLSLFGLFKPDVIVADFAPTAILAAHVSGQPVVGIGEGFDWPPARHPLPSIRPWESVPAERLRNSEAALLEALNATLAAFQSQNLRQVGDFFSLATPLLTTLPELDHFGPRPGATYVGPIYSTPAGAYDAPWPAASGPKILGYLRAHTRGIEALIEVLQGFGAAVLCVPGPSHRLSSSGNCAIYSDALRLEALLPEADIVLTNGNITTSARALLAGAPVLCLPTVVEQQLAATRIQALKLGLTADSRDGSDLYAQLKQLLTEPFRSEARRFAARYAHESVSVSTERASVLIEAAACRSGR